MENLGFIRVAAAVPRVDIADPDTNARRIIEMARQAAEKGISLIVFPELSVTGYTCGDLFNQSLLLDKALQALDTIADQTLEIVADKTLGCGICIVVGAPIMIEGSLYNCAAVIQGGRVRGLVPKTYLPNYNEFYEKRWFTPATALKDGATLGDIPVGRDLIFDLSGVKFGIEICEDLWVPAPPAAALAMAGADMVLNLSATDENIGKHAYLLDLIRQQSARCRCAYIYSSAGAGESSTDLVFSGNGIIAEDGAILAQSPRFSRDDTLTTADVDIEKLRNDRRRFATFAEGRSVVHATEFRTVTLPPGIGSLHNPAQYTDFPNRNVARLPFVDSDPARRDENCGEIISIQTWGLEQRLEATGCKKLVIGISGGLDSTLALLVAVRAFDRLGINRKGIIGITMPGYGTTTRTHSNATDLMRLLGVTSMEISIAEAVDQHFKDIGQSKEVHDATYENGQARERTQILMDMANKTGGMVLGTGDLSELALGWCTYNGDQISMYGVNASIPKTLVRHLVEWFAAHADADTARVLRDIIDTPISPELIPADNGADTIAQKTEDLVGPYELHDFFLYHTLRNGFSPRKVFALARKAFSGEYDDATLLKWLRNFYRRFFSQQFKRSCMPDGPKVGSVCLSPRGDWRMPSDATSRLWLAEVDALSPDP
ncbi:MAG: NAD(+) synthase [Muribaculaceae bacterium]|nr:NAD(+) synthase [Muribaculaceae bacterium]